MIKKRFLSIGMAVILILGLTACGETAETPSEEVRTEETATTEVTQEDTVQEVEEEEEQVTVTFEEWGFNTLATIDALALPGESNYYMAGDGEKYFLVDTKGNRVEASAFSQEIETDWDSYVSKQAQNTFIAQKKNEDGTFNCYIIAADTLEVKCALTNDLGYITSYLETITGNRIIKTIRPQEEIYDFYELMDDGSLSEGHWYAKDNGNLTYIGTPSVTDGYSVVKADSLQTGLIDIEGNEVMSESFLVNYSIIDEEGVFNSVKVLSKDGYHLTPFKSTVDSDGWIAATKTMISENGDGTFRLDTFGAVFYNTLTDEAVPIPEENKGLKPLKQYGINGATNTHTADGYALIKMDEDAEGKDLFKIFDVSKGDFVSDAEYLTVDMWSNYDSDISFLDSNRIFVKHADGTVGFLNSSFNDLGVSYEHATLFVNGYAIIFDNGLYYVINENFEKVSQGFEAEAVYNTNQPSGYYINKSKTFTGTDFIYEKEGKQYLIRIEVE